MKVTLESEKDFSESMHFVKNYDGNKGLDPVFISNLIGEVRNSLSLYCINGMDNIGPMKCKSCSKEWMAIVPKSAKMAQCPFCGIKNQIGDQQ